MTVCSVQSRMTVQERSDAAEMLWRGAVTQQPESSMTKRELAVLPSNWARRAAHCRMPGMSQLPVYVLRRNVPWKDTGTSSAVPSLGTVQR